MAYSEQARRYASDMLEQRRAQGSIEYAAAREKAFSLVPELRALESEAAGISVSAAKAMMGEGGGEVKQALDAQLTEIKEKQARLLAERGLAVDLLCRKYFCARCKDTGSSTDGKICECAEKLMQGFSFAEIKRVSPLELSSFDAFSLDYYSTKKDESFGNSPRDEMTENLRICKEFAERFPDCPKSLLLLGDAGLGKTHLALSIAKRVSERGYDAVYCGAASILRKVETEYFEEHRDSTTLESLKGASLLVLDDLGAEYNSPYVKVALYDLIDYRIIAKKPTIFTTNFLRQDALISRYGEKITSRLLGCCMLLPFYGEDVRIIRNNE